MKAGKKSRRHIKEGKMGAIDSIEAIRPDVAIVTLGDIHKLITKDKEDVSPPKEITDTDKRIERMADILSKVPQLMEGIENIRNELTDQDRAVDNARKMEKSLKEEMAEIRDSLRVLRDDIVKKTVEEGTDSLEMGDSLKDALDDINEQVSSISESMNKTFSGLNEKIEKAAKERSTAVSAPLRQLAKDIESVKSELPKFISKKDLLPLAGGKAGGPTPEKEVEGSAAMMSRKEKVKMPADKAVKIADLHKFLGKEIEVECSLELLKSIKKKGVYVYWYKTADDSGESILTSYKKMKEGKARIRCLVDKTSSGNNYLSAIKVRNTGPR
jgi:uncharacterized phage infection (PIP) family protein YhgE